MDLGISTGAEEAHMERPRDSGLGARLLLVGVPAVPGLSPPGVPGVFGVAPASYASPPAGAAKDSDLLDISLTLGDTTVFSKDTLLPKSHEGARRVPAADRNAQPVKC